MKKILVLNSGSTSVKFQLFAIEGKYHQVLAKGLAERIGIDNSQLTLFLGEAPRQVIRRNFPDHNTAVKAILDSLLSSVLQSLDELCAVGHRMGHGGEYFNKSVIINEDVMSKIYETADLLPLHSPAFIKGIKVMQSLLPNIPQVATFDSAFHQTMPEEAYLYSLPLEQYREHRIRRYGFHGTSHFYVTQKAAEMLGGSGRFISCHLGGGASITAVKDGKSIDTSMGFTPAAGIMMGTRAGDIDPYIPLHIMKTQNKTPDEINDMLNKQSGLAGISGGYSDLRDIEEQYLAGNSRAVTAVNVYVYNIIKYIGAYVAALDGLDALIFTAGVGENSSFIRKKICDRLSYLGISLDDNANRQRGTACLISTPASFVKVLIIPTNEELVIAEDTYALTTNEEKITRIA